MKRILIADANKASLIMTSEIFKDYYPGIQVCTVHTSQDAIQIAQNENKFDIFVIDFDLPDQDGAYTALKIKKLSKKPVLITAFENQEVLDTLAKKFNKYTECQNFLRKPLQPDVVRALCEYYCMTTQAAEKRTVACNLNALISFNNSEINKNTQSRFIVSVEECSLNSIRIKCFQSKYLTSSVTESWNTNHLKNIFENSQVILKFQDPYDIEIGQNLDLEHSSKIENTKLLELFKFSLNGKIVQPFVVDNNAIEFNFWVEFDNVLLSKKIFEAIMRQKMHKQAKKISRMF